MAFLRSGAAAAIWVSAVTCFRAANTSFSPACTDLEGVVHLLPRGVPLLPNGNFGEIFSGNG